MKPTVLPDSILNKLPNEERAKLGKAGMTAEEAQAKIDLKNERDLQKLIANWLHLHNIPFIQARNDKRSTIAVGWPDFTFPLNGRFVAIEVKFGKGKLRPEQEKFIAQLNAHDAIVGVVRSFDEFKAIVDRFK